MASTCREDFPAGHTSPAVDRSRLRGSVTIATAAANANSPVSAGLQPQPAMERRNGTTFVVSAAGATGTFGSSIEIRRRKSEPEAMAA